MCGRLAGISRSRASIEQIDLATRWRIFHKIRRRRAKGDIAAIGTHGRSVAFVVCWSAIGRRGEKSGTRLAARGCALASIPQKDLRAIVLKGSVGNIAAVKTQRWSLFGNHFRRGPGGGFGRRSGGTGMFGGPRRHKSLENL